jgi:MOSC domain-containing protein YiiM
MRIISLNVGLPCAQRYEGREVITAGAKKPVPRAVLRFGNFDGDRQADQVNHGGFEKAVCVYPFDHYPYWSRQLACDLQPGAFSENLTVSGAIETEVCGRCVPDRGGEGAGQPAAHAVRQGGRQE